jgi:DNA-binding CsgD family transcriptional regulator
MDVSKQQTNFIQQWSHKNLAKLNFSHISYLHIDMHQESIQMLSTSDDWYHTYFINELDKQISQRVQRDYTYWSQLDVNHQKTLHIFQKNTEKIDLCLRHQNSYEILSLHTPYLLNVQDFGCLYKVLPMLSYHAHKFRKNAPHLCHNLRDRALLSTSDNLQHAPADYLERDNNRFRFNDINLTALELKYLTYLSSLMSQKEIAYRHQVSETSVRKVISNIKKKFGHEAMPNSQLFQKLKENGVTLAYFKELIQSNER